MYASLPVILFLLQLFCIWSAHAIHDPLNIFCGSDNCYDVLTIERASSLKEVKKAYRNLSLIHHPDKSKEANATEIFRKVAKAYQVLSGNESRELFDYYLDHPKDYFRVSVTLLLLSWLFHTVQYQKWERVIKYLKNATLHNLPESQGGTPQTQELFRRAEKLFTEHLKEAKVKPPAKLAADSQFANFVDQVVLEVEIEGGYRKPTWRDLLIIRVICAPHSMYLWARKYHKRHYSSQPLSELEQVEMCTETLGAAAWAHMTDSERARATALRVWTSAGLLEWTQEQEIHEAQLAASAGMQQQKMVMKKLLPAKKLSKGQRKALAKKLAHITDEDDDEYIE